MISRLDGRLPDSFFLDSFFIHYTLVHRLSVDYLTIFMIREFLYPLFFSRLTALALALKLCHNDSIIIKKIKLD